MWRRVARVGRGGRGWNRRERAISGASGPSFYADVPCMVNRECVCRHVCRYVGWECVDGEILVPVGLCVWMCLCLGV